MSIDEKRWSALWRYHERVLDASALILAISRSQIADWEFIYPLVRDRQIIQLTDLIHDFSYNARKVIELTEASIPQIMDIAKEQTVHRDVTTLEIDDPFMNQIELTTRPLWWILCKIVHSRELIVLESSEIKILSQRTGKHRFNYRPIAIWFRADRDEEDQKHYVHIESLITVYLSHIAPYIVEAAKGQSG
jgi:hypothetical protein